MTRFLMFGMIIVGCLSCQKKLNLQRYQQTILIDSIALETNLPLKKRTNVFCYYPIYYIGRLTDTIRLGKQLPSHGLTTKLPDIVLKHLDQISITVDTSINFTNHKIFESYSIDSDVKQLDSIVKEPAYAIIVKNQSDSTLYIGSFNDLGNVVMQYQSNAKWIDLEIPMDAIDRCATGAKQIFLKPKQLLVAKLIKYKGNFDALCRLKLKNFDQIRYSNTFHFKIDRSQRPKLSGSSFSN